MRRDWPLVVAGLGIVVLSGAVVLIATLAYHLSDPPCPSPPSDVAGSDGCYEAYGGFDAGIQRPGAIVLLAVALGLLAIALVTIRRGLAGARRRP
jgi:hypothetical protein